MCGTNVPYFKLLSHACGTDDLFLWRCDPFLKWYSTHMVQTTLILRCCPTYVVQMTHIIMCCSCTCSLDDPYFNVLPTRVTDYPYFTMLSHTCGTDDPYFTMLSHTCVADGPYNWGKDDAGGACGGY